MNFLDLSLDQARREFGARLTTLNTGQAGIRAGLHTICRDVAGADYELDFIASDNSVDRYNEVIQPGAWGDMANFKANPVIPDCHDYSSVAKILGKAKSVSVANGKLVNRVAFCMDNPMGALCYKMAKGGFVNSQSVGFIPLEWTSGQGDDQPDRTYTKCELLEISMVVVPANPGATVGLALKSGAIQRSDITELVKFLKQFSNDKDGSSGATGAPAARADGARLLEMMRSFRRMLAS
jgi:HK97 family phage prohead protease